MRKLGVRLSFIKPMEPERFDNPPAGTEWSHEIKFDGYRTQVIKDADGIRLYTKSGIDWTAKYRPLADEAAKLEAESFIIEGEVIVTNEAGLSDFQALRRPSRVCREISTWSRSTFSISTAMTCATCR